MPRACVIVLDAVGAGELPDAEEYGDAGSNTLGNVARAVGGLDLPNLEALGLGNVMPLEGCPPQPGAPAVAGRLFEPPGDTRSFFERNDSLIEVALVLAAIVVGAGGLLALRRRTAGEET